MKSEVEDSSTPGFDRSSVIVPGESQKHFPDLLHILKEEALGRTLNV